MAYTHTYTEGRSFTATPCETCDHVHMETRKQSYQRWMCVKFPRVEGLSPVAPTQWMAIEPYNRCVSVNLGHCPLWTLRRNGQLELNTKEKANAA